MKDLKNTNGRKIKRMTEAGKAYVAASYIFIFLFIAMIGYMVWFQVHDSGRLRNNTYYTRRTKNSTSVVKGAILSRDGEPIAFTVTDDAGNEDRRYSCGSLFAQTVGYSEYGSAGLEATQTHILTETNAPISDQIYHDAIGKKNTGDSVVSSFSLGLSQIAYDALGDRTGTVFVLSAQDNSVLADISKPDFNPQRVADEWDVLNEEDSGSPFINRALQGLYPPGSTFKIVTALAYLNRFGSYDAFSFNCTGEYTCGGFTMHCANGACHGEQNLTDAFANSCNCAFAYIACELLEERTLYDTAAALKFGSSFSLALPSSKSRFTLEKAASDGLTAQTAIGQGETLATPMQMAMIASAIYNGGQMFEPMFVLGSADYKGNAIKQNSARRVGQVMDSATAQVLRDMMRSVITDGTGTLLSALPYEICGKTGTAQYNDNPDDAHSWFVGFSDTGNDDIIVVVLLEGAQNYETAAIDIAYPVFSGWFSLNGR